MDGYQGWKSSWMELLSDCTHRGLTQGQNLTIADEVLGFWSAIREIYTETKEQTPVACNNPLILYKIKFEEACDCFVKDKDVLFLSMTFLLSTASA